LNEVEGVRKGPQWTRWTFASELRCYAEFYVGKIPRIRIVGAPLERAVVLKWFYSLTVGRPLSEVNALYRVFF